MHIEFGVHGRLFHYSLHIDSPGNQAVECHIIKMHYIQYIFQIDIL